MNATEQTFTITTKLERLRELSPEAALEVQKVWPRTLRNLDMPDGTDVLLPGLGKKPIEILKQQLAEHLDEEIEKRDPSCICYPGHHDVPGGREPACSKP